MGKRGRTIESIELLLQFMRGDNRIRDAFHWSVSLNYRILAIDILKTRVLEQVPKASSELEELRKSMKARLLREYFELAVLYEAFLNSVYSLFENISHFVRLVYPSKSLAWGFSKQKEKFLANKDLDEAYSKILEKTEWYDEINNARTEIVHFLSGSVTINDSSGFGYLITNPQNKRAGASEQIKINSIEQHVKQSVANVNQFLKEFADHFLKIIDQNSRTAFVCISPSDTAVGAISYSLKEYLNGGQGTCEHSWSRKTCPEFDSCMAKKK